MVSAILNTLGTLEAKTDDENGTDEESERVEKLVNHGIRAVGVRGPDVTLHEQRTQIRTPGVTRPSQDLQQETPVGLHGTEQLGLLAALDVRVPAMANHPPCKEFVITRVKLIFAEPEIVGETVQKFGILENDSAVGSSAAGKAGNTAVDVGGGRDFDVTDSQAECGEDFPNGHLVANGLDTLRGTDTADFLILKAGQHARQHGWRPNGVIVGKYNDIGRSVANTVGHLKTFVGKWNCQDANTAGIDGIGEFLQRSQHAFFRDNKNFLWLAD